MLLRRSLTPVLLTLGLGAAVLVAGCAADPQDPGLQAGSSAASEEAPSDQRFPDVEEAVPTREEDGTWTFEVTISSPYDSPERYADGWRVTSPDGEDVYGEHELTHDHASEQPFTRTQTGVEVPDDLDEVVVEGRDTDHGYGGGTVSVALD